MLQERKENVKTESKKEIAKRIIEYFKANEDVFNDCIEELDAWNGYLQEDRYFEMELLDEILGDSTPTQVLHMGFHGYDENSYDPETETYKGEFNPNQPYFKFNGYGNLVSAYFKDYSAHLDEYFVKDLADEWNRIGFDNEELEHMLYDYQNAED